MLAFAAREGKAPEAVALEALQEKLSPNGKRTLGPTPAELESVVASRLTQGYISELAHIEQDIATAKGIIADLGLRFLEAEVEYEPDDPGDTWVVLTAEAPSTVSNVLDLQLQWHERLESFIGVDHSHLRICIYRAPQ